VLRYVAAFGSVLECVAVCCSVAVCCGKSSVAERCNVLR